MPGTGTHHVKHMVIGLSQHFSIHHSRIRHGEEISPDVPGIG